MTDGNVISQGIGDGEAQLIAPFAPDTSLIQANWNRVDRQREQKIAQQKAAADKEAAQKKYWDDQLMDTYRYDPLDDVPMKKLHKDFLDAVANHKPGEDDRAIKEAALGIKIFADDSLNTFKKRSEIQKSIREQSDSNWMDGIEDYQGGLVPSSATDLGTAAQQLQARQMAMDKFKVGSQKIKDIPTFVQDLATKIPANGRVATGQYKDASGQIQTTYANTYDPKAVEDAFSIAYQTHNKDLAPTYKTEQDFIDYAKQYTNPKTTISGKYEPSSQATTNANLGGGTSVAGNFTFNPSVKYNFYDKKAQTEAYKKYYSGIEAASANESASQKKKILNTSMDEESFNRKYPYTYLEDAIPFGVKGTAENSPRKFIVEGEKEQITGVSTLYSPSRKAFIVQTNNGVYLAPVEKNTNYISDNGATLDEFYSAVGQTQGGNVVKTGSDGSVISKEKDSSKKEIPQQYKDAIDWLNKNPKGKQSDEIRKLLKSKGYL